MKLGRWLSCLAVAASLVSAASCGDVNTALQHQSEARHRTADLQVQFTKAADASNRAVMANTQDVAEAAGRDAEQAKQAIQKDLDALQAILTELDYAKEKELLQSFATGFAAYRELDRKILDLVVEQTNLKAQRLAFGPAREAADAVQAALEALKPSANGDAWQIKAFSATAMASIREIQSIQAPHIADPDDASMDVLEKRMTVAEAEARRSFDGLTPLVSAASRPVLAKARTGFDRFTELNGELVMLSRRNSNVRSLALSLNDKQKLIAPCEESLRALRDALAKRGYPAGRVPPG
jgi:hypothetical protein